MATQPKFQPCFDAYKSTKRKLDTESIKHALIHHLTYSIGKDTITANNKDWFNALARVARDRVAERWMDTTRGYYQDDVKRVYYLSLEFLIGRTLINSLLNIGFFEAAQTALNELCLDIELIMEEETDAALGNGGLGRLAACFIDSMATLHLPGYGYGLRYDYGMFEQQISHGEQQEVADNWLQHGNPWEFPRPDVAYPVEFCGRVVAGDKEEKQWIDTETVMAMAYDTPITGYQNNIANTLRLWSAEASSDFDLQKFNQGNYIEAVQDKVQSANLTRVLYPDDSTDSGKELRLRQQHFFVSSTIQDILRRYLSTHSNLQELHLYVAIQLNDTHPAIAVAELMRLLVDKYDMNWNAAWETTRQTFSYTNHTLLPEALETWPSGLFEYLLPRHLQIIFEINHRFLMYVMHRYPGDFEKIKRMSLISEEGEQRIRMAHLAIVGSHKVNGVAELHSELIKNRLFNDFHDFYPGKFVNMTNGITPRLWLNQANPLLSAFISKHIGDDWRNDLSQLKKLLPLTEQADKLSEFMDIKQHNKKKLAGYISECLHFDVDPESLFDVQIKRIHEYKRQLLNILYVITRYNSILQHPEKDWVPRTIIFGGKAAPSYTHAKLIIKLIHDVAEVINNDSIVRHFMKVAFVPDYDVSKALRIIPAADLSEQISTAGMEASGTGNMKLSLNGALTIGTLDGANIEICEEVGEDNIFIFGLSSDGIEKLRAEGYQPHQYADQYPPLKQTLNMIHSGYFSPDKPNRYHSLIDHLLSSDYFMLLADFEDYARTQERVDELYQKPQEWARQALINVANMGKFSSDRTITEYAEKIWNINPKRQD